MTILIFVLPLILTYELWLLFASSTDPTIKAHHNLIRFLERFDLPIESGLYIGGILIIVILFLWHLFSNNSWTVKCSSIIGSLIESIIFSIPLLIISKFVQNLQLARVEIAKETLSYWGKIAISAGAGLYEEFIFRMIIFGLTYILTVDLIKASNTYAIIFSLIISSLLFILYHEPNGNIKLIVFYGIASLYLGSIFLSRGFGITVGTHTIYDLFALGVITPTSFST